MSNLPKGFVYLTDIIPHIIIDMRYYSNYNFVGTRLDGYTKPIPILTEKAAIAFKKAAENLLKQGYYCKVYDAYRPQRAVNHIVEWAQDPKDVSMQPYFYPDIDKTDIIPGGYISKKSGHSRGVAIDITLVDIKTGKDLDMGTMFDYFGKESAPDYTDFSQEILNNRNILKDAMLEQGFKMNLTEWWHFILIDEPFPDTQFDFIVE